jgi:hypothetical protein
MAHPTRKTPLTVEALESKALLSTPSLGMSHLRPHSPIGQPVQQPEGRFLVSGLSYSMTSNQSVYQVGQPIQLTFTETNVSGQPIAIDDGPSIDGFAVMQDGKTIWRSNAGVTPLYLRLVTLQPGQALTLTSTWNGVPNIGPATTSTATGTFVASNQQDPGAMATFQIVGSASQTSSAGGANGSSPSPSAPSTPNSPDPVSPANPAPVTATLASDHSAYRRGQVIHLTLTLTNTGTSAVNLAPDPAADGFTVSRGSTMVWRWARRSPAFGAHTLQPGGSITLKATWNGRANQPGFKALGPGNEIIRGQAGGYAASTTITIGRGH